MSFALRPAGVLGTLAHDWAKGAAANEAPCALPASLVVAVADVATARMVSAAAAMSQRRLCIDSLRLIAPGAPFVTAAPASSHALTGVPLRS